LDHQIICSETNDKILLWDQHRLVVRLARFARGSDTVAHIQIHKGNANSSSYSVDTLRSVKNVFSIVYVLALRYRPLSTYLGLSVTVSGERRSTDSNVLVLGTRRFGDSSTYRCLAPSVLPRISPSTSCLSASRKNVYAILHSHTAFSTIAKQTDEHNLTCVYELYEKQPWANGPRIIHVMEKKVRAEHRPYL
jgi:hypothetical protein